MTRTWPGCCAFSSSAPFGRYHRLVGFLGRGPEAFRADDEHRRPGAHVVGGGASEAQNEGARIPATERAQFSGKNDDLSREWLATRQVRRG
jgi:hypothetical protein